MNDNWTRKITLIGKIVAIIGGGGILGWLLLLKTCIQKPEKEQVPVIVKDTVIVRVIGTDEMGKQKNKEISSVNSTATNIPQTTTDTLVGSVDETPVRKNRIEATGESGYQKNEKWAREEALKVAEKELSRILHKSDISYEIDNGKSTAYLVDGYGYKAKIVIFTFK
jgi:hypothetical protein